jgi:hypothetical protein
VGVNTPQRDGVGLSISQHNVTLDRCGHFVEQLGSVDRLRPAVDFLKASGAASTALARRLHLFVEGGNANTENLGRRFTLAVVLDWIEGLEALDHFRRRIIRRTLCRRFIGGGLWRPAVSGDVLVCDALSVAARCRRPADKPGRERWG